MVYNFKARFVPLIQSGQKLTTIRAPRKDGELPKPGEVLHLFTGMRTKACRKIGERICKSVNPISMKRDGPGISIRVNGRGVSLKELAAKDGFMGIGVMMDFFVDTHGLPFKGYLIEWEPALKCVKHGCNYQTLVWLRVGQAIQTTNGFLIPKVKGWYCPICAGSYGGGV